MQPNQLTSTPSIRCPRMPPLTPPPPPLSPLPPLYMPSCRSLSKRVSLRSINTASQLSYIITHPTTLLCSNSHQATFLHNSVKSTEKPMIVALINKLNNFSLAATILQNRTMAHNFVAYTCSSSLYISFHCNGSRFCGGTQIVF